MRSVILCLVVALLACAPLVEAQVPDTARANRTLERLVTRLGGDESLPDSLRHLSVDDLVGPTNFQHAAGLDDSLSSLFMRALALTLHQVPNALCGSFLGASPLPEEDLGGILPYLDSTTLAKWSTVLEGVVHVRAHPTSMGRVASDSMTQTVFLRVFNRLSEADQLRVLSIGQRPAPTSSDACWSMQTMMDGLANLPAEVVGPVVRAMMVHGEVQK